jgi:N12 class adenine-specific DNA methylase
LTEKKERQVTFEQLGIDSLFVDEAHYYKNLATSPKCAMSPESPTPTQRNPPTCS